MAQVTEIVESIFRKHIRATIEIILALILVFIFGFQFKEVNKLINEIKEKEEIISQLLGNKVIQLIPEPEQVVLTCLDMDNPSTIGDEIHVDYAGLEEPIKELAEGVAGRLGLCINKVQRDKDEDTRTFEFILTDKFSGSKVLELDIKELDLQEQDENISKFVIDEYERVVSWNFILRNSQPLQNIKKFIEDYCVIPTEFPSNEFIIEVSDRREKTIPGLRFHGENIYYEIECIANENTPERIRGKYINFEVNDQDQLVIDPTLGDDLGN